MLEMIVFIIVLNYGSISLFCWIWIDIKQNFQAHTEWNLNHAGLNNYKAMHLNEFFHCVLFTALRILTVSPAKILDESYHIRKTQFEIYCDLWFS